MVDAGRRRRCQPPTSRRVAQLIKYSDAARTQTHGGHRLQPAAGARSTTGSSARGSGGLDSGVGADRASRACSRTCDGTGVTTRAGHHQPGAQAGLHRLRHLHLRPERPAGLRVPEAEREAGGVHRPADVGLHQPGLQGLRRHQRDVLGARRVRRPTGRFMRNLVGLGAVAVERIGTRRWARTSRATRRPAIGASRSPRSRTSSSTSRVRACRGARVSPSRARSPAPRR